MKVAILTISDRCAAGEAEDKSGEYLCSRMAQLGNEVIAYLVVPDDREQISCRLIEFTDQSGAELVLTTGGTGLAPGDVTPEATRAVIEKEVPGLGEAMRAQGWKSTPHALLSRAVVGIRGKSLIVNLPGSTRGARESLEAILPTIPHAVEIIKGQTMQDENHIYRQPKNG